MIPSKISALAKNRRFQVSLIVIVSFVAIGVIGPYMTPDPYDFVTYRAEPPSEEYRLGTDTLGRDVLARLVVGIRDSILLGAVAGMLSLLIIILTGGLGGFVGGVLDDVLNLNSNVFLVIPTLPILIILSLLLEHRSIFLVAGIISLTSWAGGARAMRAQVLSLKRRRFVDLARITGIGNLSILFKEILPNMLSYVFVSFCGAVGGAMIAEAGISLLGLGPSTTITLGLMLYEALATGALLGGRWWLFLPPGILLTVFPAALVIMGSAIDATFNPKMIEHYE